MDSITIDGLHEDAFRQSIEDLLRRGLSDEAATRLRSLLEPFTGEGQLFPARFMSVSHEEIELSGWETLDEGFRKFDRAEQPVTAICLSFGDPEGRPSGPDSAGMLSPTVETSYFSDEAFPFSESDRNDLLDGYSSFGCQWAGDCEGIDHAISFRGADDLHGSLAELEQRLLNTSNPDPEEIRAGTIASCYLAVLFHQALRDNFAKHRLGRPLCVLTANNGVYPSFDAPVLSCDEYLAGGEVTAIAANIAPEWVPEDSFAPPHVAEDEDEDAEEASLLSIGIRRTAKQPVLALAETEADMSMDAMANAALSGDLLPPPPIPSKAILQSRLPRKYWLPSKTSSKIRQTSSKWRMSLTCRKCLKNFRSCRSMPNSGLPRLMKPMKWPTSPKRSTRCPNPSKKSNRLPKPLSSPKPSIPNGRHATSHSMKFKRRPKPKGQWNSRNLQKLSTCLRLLPSKATACALVLERQKRRSLNRKGLRSGPA